MIFSHMYRILKNKRSWLSFCIVLCIPFFEIAQLIMYQRNSNEVFHPAFAFFLTGSSIGHAPQIMLIWFLPIYFLMLVADDPIQDYQTGYRYVLISKIGKKKYIFHKMFISFILSFFTMCIALVVNFIFVSIIFSGGTFTKGVMELNIEGNALFQFSVNHPYAAIFIFSFVSCFMAGLAGLLGSSMSLFFLDRKYAYAASFFIWFLMILKRNSIVYLFQPFTEYGLDVLIPTILLAWFIFLVISTFVFVYEVKYNES
ncbi:MULTISPECIES: DUF2705 family protein [Anoxybacillus]|nr:DUF2705 family protein [uncultured Anoxybacillus sp.]